MVYYYPNFVEFRCLRGNKCLPPAPDCIEYVALTLNSYVKDAMIDLISLLFLNLFESETK